MDKRTDNDILNDVYQNAHIALQSISNVLETDVKGEIREELKVEYDGYEKVMKEIEGYMKEKNLEPKDINTMKKAMLKGSIKMKTFINDEPEKIADMMVKGTVMGITELMAIKNDKSLNLNDDTYQFVNELLSLEERYEERLKKYL
ncbi:MAG: hypothetical protein E7342_00030 [Clostridiales bacterium]|nr:hypothetical protein [Clostridiales bacterium]